MCGICGCGDHLETTTSKGKNAGEGETHEHSHEHGHEHSHEHNHQHSHGEEGALTHTHSHEALVEGGTPGGGQSRTISLEQSVYAKNDQFAAANADYFAKKRIFALNLLSSPGSGKTSLLVATIEALRGKYTIGVIEGDQQTNLDAERIRAAGAPSVQINTGRGCHLDAHGVAHAVEDLNPSEKSMLFIENVGNLVCPALFNLGEAYKVVILSVTEGEDKPLKYPDMFSVADLVIFNKIDLLPYVNFDLARSIELCKKIKPTVQTLALSATKGEGLEQWVKWLEERFENYPQRATNLGLVLG